MYITSIIFTEENLAGNFVSDGHKYRVETNTPFSSTDFENVLYQALEIERIYSGRVFVQITKEKDGQYVSCDETIVKVSVELTSEPSDFIDWSKCPNLPLIYKIDRAKSNYTICNS